ncbi:hypothetical protein PVK06_010447 [Gossypium arboreum]|uniref:Uncharacterized protein n=1 Tax=Gossypium arboreum TaxID=29729 RepID=A0ABR0Q6Y9_GOSAR|nr:hypothetical protein PVK06_010447 [Gossypium arboreum]
MDSKCVWGVSSDELPVVDNFISMKKNKFETYLEGIQNKIIHQERGFEFPMDSGGEIWDIVRSHKWENLDKHPTKLACILVVQEFYALLKEYEEKRPFGEPWLYVTVKGKEILISGP